MQGGARCRIFTGVGLNPELLFSLPETSAVSLPLKEAWKSFYVASYVFLQAFMLRVTKHKI